MSTIRQVFSDIKGDKPKVIKKKRSKIVPTKQQGVDWGKDDPCNFDVRDKQESSTA